MVVTFMCARGPAPHVACGRKTLQTHGFLYKHMGKLQRAITLILRCESKFFQVKSLVSTHSACPCKNYPPKCSLTPHELDYLIIYLFNYLFKFAFFFYLVYNKSLRLIVKKECFDLALMWAITGLFFRGHFRSLITRALADSGHAHLRPKALVWPLRPRPFTIR